MKMMVQPEKRLLWHPRYDNKFVVGGNSQITLYEWAAEYPEIRHVTSRNDLHFMKSFAWSPDPTFDDLIAVGLSTGKVDLIRLEAGKQTQRKNVLSNGPSVTLPVRNSRSCNALAFNPVDPNYLAVGLDKVRGDASLVIWDISTFALSLSLPIEALNNDNQAEMSSLINTLSPLASRPQPLLPRVENQTRIDARIVQQYAQTEVVSSLSFLPGSTNLLLAGISQRWLRLFDLRSPSAAVVNVASKVNEIATDPFDRYRIACYSDTAITVWDARHLGQPILTFSEKDALADGARIKTGSGTGVSYAHIEFSNTRRECLATLEKDANYVRFWDLRESRLQSLEGVAGYGAGSVSGTAGSSDAEARGSRDSSRTAKRSWAPNLPWQTAQTPSPSKEKDPSRISHGPGPLAHVLADTRRTKSFSRPLTSFALVPMSRSNAGQIHYPLTSNVMVVNKEGDLELYAIHDTTKQVAWSARGDLAIGAGVGMKVLEGYKEETTPAVAEAGFADGIPRARSNTRRYRSQEGDRVESKERRKMSRSRSRPADYSRDESTSRVRGRPGNVNDNGNGNEEASSSSHRRRPRPVSGSVQTPVVPVSAGASSPALFGRGDEDGFPALSATTTSAVPSVLPTHTTSSINTGDGNTNAGASANAPLPVATVAPPVIIGGITSFMESNSSTKRARSSLSASRPGKQRTYSPASVRKYPSGERGEPRALSKRSLSRTDTIIAEDGLDRDETNAHAGNTATSSASAGAFRKEEGFAPIVHHQPRVSVMRDRSMTVTRVGKLRDRDKEARKQGIMHVVQEDISMVMRKRAKAGYGLSQPQHNIVVTDEPSDGAQHLSELWAWISHSHEILCVPTSRLHRYDFSFHGLLGIWEGFPPIIEIPLQPQQQSASDEMIPSNQRSLLLDLPANPQQLQQQHHTHTSSTGSSGGAGGTGSSVQPQSQQQQLPVPLPPISTRRSRSPTDDWSAALNILAARRGIDQYTWKPTVHTNKLVQRQIGLLLCGWSLKDEELAVAIRRWEREGKLSRATCWLVFSGQYSKAVDLLMRSDDETHQMMSGAVAALSPLNGSSSSKGYDLREHYGRLIIRLHDPYFRVMLTHLAMGDWSEVLEEETIPFRERVAIAFQFLDDKSLTSYLKRAVDNAKIHGDIDALLVTGLTAAGMSILQSYLDRTGDVQSAAILSCYVVPQRFRDRRAERWLETYRDLLDGFKLHHLRVGLDIERGQILHEAMQSGDMARESEEWAPKQILIRCHFCNKSVSCSSPGQQPQTGRPTACPNCSRELPRCSVCLMTLAIVQDAAREVDLGYTQHRDTFDDAIVICQTCRHGGHAAHILEWFMGDSEDGCLRRTHDVCPVADCNCRCADEF